jgi:hypothetical protein
MLPDHMIVCLALDDGFHLGVLSSRVHVTWSLRAGGWLGIGNDPRYSKSRCFDPFPFPNCAESLKANIRAVAEELDTHRKARQAKHPRLTLTQMYNVLEKVRAGEALDADDECTRAEGLVLILKELHDTIDALVFEAYGWTDSPTDDQILDRLVKLNAERALAEKAGRVLWLRPDYQIPRFGSDAERERLDDERRKAKADVSRKPNPGTLDLDEELGDMLPSEDGTKPKYPTGDELAETAAVMSVLANAPDAITIAGIATKFSQGKAVEKRVAATITALARLGHLTTTDGGGSFAMRRG